MASTTSFSHLAFFCSLNLLFFTLVTATCTCPCPPKSKSPPQPKPYTKPKPKPNPNPHPSPNPIPTPYPEPNPSPNPIPTPYPEPNPIPTPYPTPKSPSTDNNKCPRDALKIGVCAKLLNNDLLQIILGEPPIKPCCTLIKGLADFEAAVCLCTAIKTSILGTNFKNIPISLSLLSHNCGREIPPSFQCP